MISCLRGAGVDVVESHRPVWQQRHNWSLGVGQLMRILEAEARLGLRAAHGADLLIVGYPGHFDLPAARRVAAGRPVVFNPLVSLYDTLVTDRGRFRAGSAAARVLSRIDRAAFRNADVVVADTHAHGRFFADRFGVPPGRIEVALVGAEDARFRADRAPTEPFHALFVGKLIPLHGVETILAAAALVPDVPFRIVGEGQLDTQLVARTGNVEHVPWIDYRDLPGAYRVAGCALGVFGTSAKAGRVIPNKAFQAIACGTPLVTADTPGARELLTDGVDALLVPPGDPAAIAAAVRRLAADPTLAAGVGERGRMTYERRASEVVLGSVWRGILERAAASR